MRQRILFILLIIISIISSCSQEDFTKYVDPTIGNVSKMLVPTYPTFHLPNQMIRMFPVKKDYIDDQITGFPLQVISHRSKGILQMKVTLGELSASSWRTKMNIDHDLEIMHPWLYSTYLIDDDIRVSFTPGEKCAIYKIEFPSAANKNVLLSGSKNMVSSSTEMSSFTMEETVKITDRGIDPETRILPIYIYGKLTGITNQPVNEAKIIPGAERLSISFPENAPATILIKYAVSYVSPHQARNNFELELNEGGFDELASNGKKRWETVINQIEVEGGTEAQKRSFYTSLYRTYERMIDINEEGKYFSGYDGKVHESTRPFYVDDWIWDTYRATHPLNTILDPAKENDILNSYTLMYEQSGWMPTFPQVHGNHMCMNSYHSSAIFIDGYRKGLRDFDIEKAYEGIHKNLTEATFIPWRQGLPKRPIDDFYHEKGFFPALRPGEVETEPLMDDFERRQAVAVTLGISYDAWTLAQLSSELGKNDDAEKFSIMAKNYENLWHPELRLFMPKDEQGEWIMINPKLDGGRGYRDYYDENNGWTYAWDVPHDIDGLTKLLGGKEAAEQRLDQLFREPLGLKRNMFYADGANSTGLVGQFSMGNEPSFHIPYLYNYFGAPWKTQKRTRFLLDVWFKDNIFGIPGDEDGGGMTAFVVFSAMGIYPVTPGLPWYTITSPVFEKTTIHLQNGKDFTVLARGASKMNKYIQKAYINGEEIEAPFISHEQIMSGATLELVLSELPNRDWGKNVIPPGY
ncbi:GH92 family glycosyl hydrolase [Bacteroidota bacterium]